MYFVPYKRRFNFLKLFKYAILIIFLIGVIFKPEITAEKTAIFLKRTYEILMTIKPNIDSFVENFFKEIKK